MSRHSRFEVIELLAPLRRYAMVLTRDGTEAEDLVHDTLVRAYERRHTFHKSGNLRAWLFSVLTTVLLTHGVASWPKRPTLAT